MKRLLILVVALFAATELYALDSLAVQAIKPVESPIVVDTLSTDSDALKVLLFNDGTWRYIQPITPDRDSTVYSRYWDNDNISPYRTVKIDSLPQSVAINLVDSLKHYRFPYVGRITSRYGIRHRRPHNGIDMALKVGDTICAAFDGRVRFSKATDTGYGTLIIIRHDNGLETYHGHLSARLVEENDRVVAGQPIGLGGNSGRSTGPHIHFETRFYGQSFDPERIINFRTGELRRDYFLLKKSYFSIYSKYSQDFNAEAERNDAEKKENALSAEKRYYKVRSGDYLGLIAKRNGTTVSAICRLNGITPNTTLQIGKVLRVK